MMQAEVDFGGTDRFAVRRRLGAGGMGVVYEALDKERGQVVALKTLRRASGAEIYRLKREFRALADTSHKNLVRLHELHAAGERIFFTMELVEGVDLLSWARRIERPLEMAPTMESTPSDIEEPSEVGGLAGGRIDVTRLRAALRQLAEGVHALHQTGLLHRDIKPSNVLVTPDERVVLLDFGLAADLDRHAQRQARDTEIVGTPAYMAPEQGTGDGVGVASDWYAVGCLLYEALTGRLPFVGRSLQVLLDKQRHDPPPPLAIDPSLPADLDELCRHLLRRRPDERPSGPEVLRRLGAASTDAVLLRASYTSISRALVGRDRELAQLRSAFADSRGPARAPVVVWVEGTSGMGKTALVRQFLDEVEDGDALVLGGRCYERESVPYKAFDTLVDALSRYLARLPAAEVEPLLPRDISALARLFPVLRQVPSVVVALRGGAEAPDPQELRRRGLAALRELCGHIAARRPLLLYVDDLQWGDVDSAAVLAELMRAPAPPPLLFVGVFRREEAAASPFRRALGAEIAAREVLVAPLDKAEAEDLALALLGGSALEGPDRGELLRRAQAVAREAGGSPFFITELVRHVQGGGDLGAQAAALEDLLAARLAHLPAAARHLLEMVAVAGVPTPQGILRQAAEHAGEDGHDLIALLRTAHLVRTRGVRDPDPIEAYHDRIRETMVARLPAEVLRAHHRRLAVTLEAGGQADAETLARHYLGAGDRARALAHTERAAAHAAETLAFDRAAALLEQAIRLSRELATDPAAIARLEGALGDALANAGRGQAAAAAYLSACASGHGDAAWRLELNRRAAEQYLRSGHVEDGLAALDGVLATIGLRLAPTPRRALMSLLVRRAAVRLRGLGHEVRDPSQVAAETLTQVDIFWSVSTGLGMVDNIRAADFQGRHLLAALRAGETYRIARALATEACYASADGTHGAERTAGVVAAARRAAAHCGQPHAQAMAIFADGFSSSLEGRFAAGGALCAEAERLFRDRCTNVAWEVTVMQQIQLYCRFYLGDLDGLAAAVPELLADAERRGDRYAVASISMWIATAAWLARGDAAGARQALAAARPTAPPFTLQHYWELYAETQIDLYERKPADALARLRRAWPGLTGSQLLRIQPLYLEALWLRARTALAWSQDPACPSPARFLAEAARMIRPMRHAGTTWSTHAADRVAAQVAAARGDKDADSLAGRAADGFAARGMMLAAKAARGGDDPILRIF